LIRTGDRRTLGGIVELLFERALLPSGIARRVAVEVTDGTLRRISANAAPDTPCMPGLAISGMPNLHSHAFQRGIAGATELSAASDNSFWGWRETMYRFVERLTLQDVAAIAGLVYLEMLEAGYTSVAEFHYLHRKADGAAYDDPAQMAMAVRSAAQQTGIRQLLLPCLYQSGGFGPLPLRTQQRRFAQDSQQFLRLFEDLRGRGSRLLATGVALHSLRAVPIQALREVFAALPADLPVHIHISEQQREVDACLAFCGRRPIEYLLDAVAVDQRWCLVHATHASPAELSAVARSGAVVGLCPTTEANLGDGRFPLDEFVASNGRFGIGSDSQVSIDPREELRAAEYALRLQKQQRGLVSVRDQPHCGTALYTLAGSGGAQALGLNAGQLVSGAVADIVVLDTDLAQFAGLPDEALMDAHIFAPRPAAVRDVMVAGQWIIRDRRHPQRELLQRAYQDSIKRLLQ
jgi:formimidoylglutamate deiminase